jgi:hypothetical protein
MSSIAPAAFTRNVIRQFFFIVRVNYQVTLVTLVQGQETAG